MRYFVYLSYDGTRFHGWQIQPNGISVEGEIERCLSTILRTPIDIVGAGRTDAGVHASLMVAHFDLPETPIPNGLCKDGKLDCEQLAYKVNRMLPPDISIHKVEQVSDDLHARFSATLRTYNYFVHTTKNPFKRHYSYECHFDLDFNFLSKGHTEDKYYQSNFLRLVDSFSK